MAGLRPAGLSEDEDSDDDDGFSLFISTKKVKSELPDELSNNMTIPPSSASSAPQSSASASREFGFGRGRGRGRGRLLYDSDDEIDSWGNSVTTTKSHSPLPTESVHNWGHNQPSNVAKVGNPYTGIRNTPGFKTSLPPKAPQASTAPTNMKISQPKEPQQPVKPTLMKRPQTNSPGVQQFYSPVSNGPGDLGIPYINAPNAEISYRIIKKAWNLLDYEEVKRQCRVQYARTRHPFCLGLFFMLRSPDFKDAVKSELLCITVIEELNKYFAENKINVEDYLTDEIRLLAFDSVIQHRRLKLKRMIYEIFSLHNVQHQIVKKIKNYSAQCCFKEAMYGSLTMKLFCFDIHCFIVPLTLQDRINLTEEYFDEEGSEDLLKEFIAFLDKLCASSNIVNWAYNYAQEKKIDIQTIRVDKLQGKTVGKLIKRLTSKYKLDKSVCPNAKKRQQISELRFIFYKKYTTDASDMVTNENLQEIVYSLIKDCQTLTDEGIYQMKTHAGIEEAVKFIKRYNIPYEWCPRDVQEILKQDNSINIQSIQTTEETWEEDWETGNMVLVKANTGNTEILSCPSSTIKVETILPEIDQNFEESFYNLPLPPEQIVKIVDTPDDVHQFIGYITKELEGEKTIYAGVDSEWKPVSSECAALLQIAFKNRVFLVDILSLKFTEDNGSHIFEAMLKMFFSHEKIVKIGYALKNDFKMLAGVSKSWTDLHTKSKAILDLFSLQNEILRKNPNFFLPSSERGLNMLVDSCLKKQLNKGEQFSDWEKRPLRSSQVEYAAKDAFVLLEIFEFIIKRDQEVSIDVQSIINSCLHGQTNSKTETTKKLSPIELVRVVLSKAQITATSSIDARHVNLFCGSMLEGLGRLLRSCGLKTMIFKNQFMIPKRERYFMVTKGKASYNELATEYGDENVLYLNTNTVIDQILEIINFFNIKLGEKDANCVCVVCNSCEFVAVTKSLIKDLWERRGYNVSKVLSANALQSLKMRIPHEMISSVKGQDRNWNLKPSTCIRIQEGDNRQSPAAFTPSNEPVEIQKIPIHLLDSIDAFYVCAKCGKCYWESEELEKFLFSPNEQPLNGANLDSA